MHYNLLFYFAISLLLSTIVQLLFFKLSHRRGLFIDDHESDQPQKFHRSPTPRVGGVGIFISCLLFALLSKTGFLLLLSAIPAFLAGLFEDVYLNLSPNKRLLIMIASGILPALLLGTVVTNFGLFTVPYWCGFIICFVAILGLINGANMIDGFNGLLAGTSLIIFGAFAYMSFLFKDHELLIINTILIGALIGFLFFNYPKGNIFMGDGGAYLLGFFMAVIAMLMVSRHSAINPFFVLLCISYPVMEVVFSFTRKGLIHHASPFQPDRNHLHMLVNRYLVKRQNSKTILIIAPVIFIYNLLAIHYYENQPILILLICSFILLYLFSYYFLLRHQQKVENRKGHFFNEILQKIKIKRK
jgi:UDP-N-acetylmuramyl pentapeptide phosphotransferase/UDP-N-acetylglucosamine-1-phosphate transferase